MTNSTTTVRKSTAIKKLAVMLGIAALLVVGLWATAWFGIVSFAADMPHSRPVYALIEFVRDRSIQVRAAEIKVPALDSKASLVRGAGNYQAMCAQCHLAPGTSDTELSRGLYPSPPNLSRSPVEASKAFWTIKHGVKASGMPAWGKSMSDADIWDLVALVRQLPRLDAKSYRGLVADSSGHSHAGATEATGAMAKDHNMNDREQHKTMPVEPPSVPAAAPDHPHKEGETH